MKGPITRLCSSGLLAGLMGCTISVSGEPDVTANVLVLTPHSGTQYQTIHNFGASDAWTTQFVGKNWPLEKRQAIADLLFSQAIKADGSPAGIALSAWRFNIGSGSAAQGEYSDIGLDWRRTETFLQADGSLDMSAQAGERWFLQAARERGVDTLIGFVNSPPVSMTLNGIAHSSGGNSANLAEERYPDFVDFLTDVIAGLESSDGIQLDYISPFNEPQWDWKNSKQEGSPWKNSEIAEVVKLLNRKLRDKQLDTRIEITESGQIDYLYETFNRPERGNQIEAFFKPDSPFFVGDLSQVARKIAGHSYYSTWNLQDFISKRQLLAHKLVEYPGLEYWMTEYCLLENNPEVRGAGRDLGIDPALYLARVIHADLTIAQASAWQWWMGISPGDYKDGLVYIDWDWNDGQFYTSKKLWALGNYSRYIRPGMTRIEMMRSDQRPVEQTLDQVMASAYLDPATQKSVVVAINYSQNEMPVQLDSETGISNFNYYRTSATEDLEYIGQLASGSTHSLPPRSITTFVEL